MKTYKEILEAKSDKELIEILKKLDVDFMCDRLGISDVRDICNEVAKRFENKNNINEIKKRIIQKRKSYSPSDDCYKAICKVLQIINDVKSDELNQKDIFKAPLENMDKEQRQMLQITAGYIDVDKQADGEYIPKQAVLEQVKEWMNNELRDKTNAYYYLAKRLDKLSSVAVPKDGEYISPYLCDMENCTEECPHLYLDEHHIASCRLDDNWQKIKSSMAIPNKVGHWNHGVCDNCGYDWGKDAPIASVPNFCQNCGAKMD